VIHDLLFSPRARQIVQLAIALSVTVCTIAGCRGRAADSEEPSGEGAAVVGVRTAVATRRPFRETVEALGTVTARPGHIAELSAPAPTRVTKVLVSVGEHVAAGAPLVQLDRAPFVAEAQSAEVALTTAEHAYERARRLVDAGILARKELDQAASDRARARSDAIAARRTQTLATLRSPIGGVVTKLRAVLGGPADPSQPLVEVADPVALDILLAVSPAVAARVRPGADVILTAGQHAGDGGADSVSGSGAGTEALGTGTVRAVSAAVDSASRSVTVRARIARPVRALRIGETVFGSIVLATRPNAVTVPVEALVPDGEGMKVFVLDSAHIAHATPVSVGARTEKLAEITRGLSGGETVVTYGAYGVTDSARVVPLAEERR
jgi:RND family efflux transporter MFP subunit